MARLRSPVALSELVHVLVEHHVPARVVRERVDDAIHPVLVVTRLDEAGGDDRARVHHRVERPVQVVDHDRVERVARRLDADPLQHRVAALVLERHAEHERLRDRLDGEREVGVAHLVDVAVGGDHADAEPVRVGAPELGDVGRHRALRRAPGTRRGAGGGSREPGIWSRCGGRGRPGRRGRARTRRRGASWMHLTLQARPGRFASVAFLSRPPDSKVSGRVRSPPVRSGPICTESPQLRHDTYRRVLTLDATCRPWPPPSPRTILVVEDEAPIAEAVAARLRSEGFAVEIAADGPAGVERCDAAPARPRGARPHAPRPRRPRGVPARSSATGRCRC